MLNRLQMTELFGDKFTRQLGEGRYDNTYITSPVWHSRPRLCLGFSLMIVINSE
jgi:hypothetical protein